ncbi:glycosyl transferase GT4 family [Eubacterium limosum]|nr:glycosyl transferase GT4 family [Eubacterium limosum]
MKILQVNSHYNYSGAGKIVADIHKELKKRGHESYVAYGRGEEIIEKDVYKFEKDYQTKLHAFLARITGLNGYFSINATNKLIKYIEEKDPDIIHLHGIHGYYINNQNLFSYIKKKDTPVIWTFHDDWAFTGKCGYYFDCLKWKEGCCNCKRIRDYPKSFLFDFSNKMWNDKKRCFSAINNLIIVSPSKWLADDARESFFKNHRIEIINNGIETENIFYKKDKNKSRNKYKLKYNQKIILAVGINYNDPRKGMKYILELSKLYENDKDVKIVVVGWNKNNDKKIKEFDNIITFPRTTNQYELSEFYSLADVFILPSEAENYATVVLESMACGTPVVGFNVGGVPEQLDENRGIAVNFGDLKQMKDAIDSYFIKTEKERDNLENNLIKWINKNNTKEIMTDKYIGLYNEVLKKLS